MSLLWRVLCLSCLSLAWAQPERVHWVGDLHSVVGLGQDQARVQLSSLRSLPHLYGLGPGAGRDGEVSLFDGHLSFAEMRQNQPVVSEKWEGSAAFLVYAQVDEWRHSTGVSVRDLADLDRQLQSFAQQQPLIFRLTGKVRSAEIHIIDRRGRPALGHEANGNLKVAFSLQDEPVECFGVFSQHHQGILTHRGSNLHIHLRTSDGRLSGHLDQLQMEEGSLCLAP